MRLKHPNTGRIIDIPDKESSKWLKAGWRPAATNLAVTQPPQPSADIPAEPKTKTTKPNKEEAK